MNELINVQIETKEGINVVSSRVIAKELGKRHKHVIDQIGKILEQNQNLSNEQNHCDGFGIIESEYNDRGRMLKEYLLTKDGLKLYLSQCRGVTPKQYEVLGIDDINVVYSYSRFEITFLDMLEKALGELDIKGYRQYNVDNKYRIDFYIPSKKIAIEYDEEQHKHQQEEDEKREMYIKNKLNCTFVRLDYQNEDIVNVMKVIKNII